MELQVFADEELAAHAAAGLIAEDVRAAVARERHFVMAVSGGRTPWIMLRALAWEDAPWQDIDVLQVDERVAPQGHADRNLTHLEASLQVNTRIHPDEIYAMPVDEPDLEAAAAQYAALLSKLAGSPPVLDLIHLGLGPDGHTASLVPGDPVLNVSDRDVAITQLYQGRRRMTLTYPVINRARRILWLATGSEKSAMLARLYNGDPSIPAGRVRRDHAVIIADRAAAGDLGT